MRRPKPAVLDSYALLALLFDEPGSDKVRRLLEVAVDCGIDHLISAVNWAEVRNAVERVAETPLDWAKVKEKLLRLPIEIVPVDRDMAEQAGVLKSKGGVSLADCFAAALAHREKTSVYTGDQEFKRLEPDIKIEWI